MNVSEDADWTLIELETLSPGCAHVLSIIYGAVVPCLAVFLLAVDGVIITVFLRPHIRSHTTYILTMIAISDIFNILPPTIVYVYFYTMGNYHVALPYAYCRWTYLFTDVFHDMFNSISLWLTVLLAYVRCRCLKTPFEARGLHKCKNIALCTVAIVVVVLAVHIPSIYIINYHPVDRFDNSTNVTHVVCAISDVDPHSLVRKIHMWTEVVVDMVVPTTFLVILDISILMVLKRAKKSRFSLRYRCSLKPPSSSDKNDAFAAIHAKGVEPETGIKTNDHHAKIDKDEFGSDDVFQPEEDGRDDAQCCIPCLRANKPETGVRYHANIHGNHTRIGLRKSADLPHDLGKPSVTKETHHTILHHKCKGGCFSLHCVHVRRGKLHSERSMTSDSAIDRLDRESRRTSWLILVIATLISTHELPTAIMYVYNLVKYHDDSLPFAMYGCYGPILNLWQYIIYPSTFLIYAAMSNTFRKEIWKVLRCKTCSRSGSEHNSYESKLFMSPCSVRRNMSRENGTTVHDSDAELETHRENGDTVHKVTVQHSNVHVHVADQ